MASAQQVQSLLRFLSQDAKVPLAQAMGQIKLLQAANLLTPESIAKATMQTLSRVFEDDKVARQILNAAKRVSKKRSLSEPSGSAAPTPSPKKIKPLYGQPLTPAEIETSLALPELIRNEDVLKSKIIFTNRAPLVLAFTVALLKYTMPEQPLSSRLSLAQAVVSMNSKTKAVHIGIDSGRTAEDEGWGVGQPVVRIMNREVRVMKRWGYEWTDSSQGTVEEATQGTVEEAMQNTVREDSTQDTVKNSTPNTLKSDSTQTTVKSSTQTTVKSDPTDTSPPKPKDPPLWGIDLEALKKANTSPSTHKPSSHLPIHTAQGARAYLLKSFETPKAASPATPSAPAKRTASSLAAEKETNLAMLMGALDLLYQSWTAVLGAQELDRRAWGWYVSVRPDVQAGQAGWGGKGVVRLGDILALRRPVGG